MTIFAQNPVTNPATNTMGNAEPSSNLGGWGVFEWCVTIPYMVIESEITPLQNFGCVTCDFLIYGAITFFSCCL